MPPRPAALAALLSLLALCTACGGGGGGASDSELFGGAGSGATTSTTAGTTRGSTGAYGPPVLAGRVAEPALTESSGLAASLRNPGLLWSHNDSGDGPLLYCLGADGASCGTWSVTGAEARDWEDMAAGPGPEPGLPYLYLGDIGDNSGELDQIVVYRVPEPDVPEGSGASSVLETEEAEALRLRYPDGPHDAEALAVNPASGDLYVITKDRGAAGVYRALAPHPPGPVIELERLAVLAVGRDSVDPRSALVTGADVAPDASRVVLSTYGLGYELVLPPAAESFDALWAQPLRPVVLGSRAQGEAVAYGPDGRALYSTSEGAPSPLFVVVREA